MLDKSGVFKYNDIWKVRNMNMREDIVTPARASHLPFQVLMSGISYCDGTYHIQRPNSPLTCIEYVIQGKGTVKEDSHTFTAKAGDVYLLHSGRNHDYFSDEQDPWIKIWMNLSGPAVEHLLCGYGLEFVNHVEGLNLEKEFRSCFETASRFHNPEEVSRHCAILFHDILQQLSLHLASREIKSSSAQKIKKLIDEAPNFNVTLEDLERQLFFTKAHIIRVFRDEYRITPYEYILSGKLRLAKDLLTNTSLPISEIALHLNFCDAHYFTNFFRTRTGMTPREYRNEKRN